MTSSKTVLPTPFASLISLGTSCSSFGLRFGESIARAAINGARVGTLTSFELGRVVIEGLLARAGGDVVQSSVSENGRLAAERFLERTLSFLHYSITQTAFLISTGFQVGSTSLASGIAISQFFLSGLDAVLGDTETSKAVATIVSLVRREFKNPDTGIEGEQVGLGDLLVGVTGFALLQRWGRHKTSQELKEAHVTETVWDIVVVKDEAGNYQHSSGHDEDPWDASYQERNNQAASTSFVSATDHSDFFDAIEDRNSFMSTASTQNLNGDFCRTSRFTEEAFRQRLAYQLKPGSSVQVLAESRTTDRIQIDIIGDSEADIDLLPGFQLRTVDRQSQNDVVRLVFDRHRKNTRRASFDVEASSLVAGESQADFNSHVGDTSEETHLVSNTSPQDQIGALENQGYHSFSPHESNVSQKVDPMDTSSVDPIPNNGLDPHRNGSDQPIFANQKRSRTPIVSDIEHATSKADSQVVRQADPRIIREEETQSNKGIDSSPLRKAMNKSRSVKNLVDFWSRERSKSSRYSNYANKKAPLSGSKDMNPSVVSSDIWDFRNGQKPIGPEPRPSSSLSHQRSNSRTFSITSVNSESSLMLRPLSLNNFWNDYATYLQRSGKIPGQYPRNDFVANLARFVRYSLASYGSNFLRLAGVVVADALEESEPHIPQHHSFSAYIDLPPSSVLLSSYVDPLGSVRSENGNESGLPLVYYVILDHESKAIVLTCRGTLGFEDILTDMTADYVNIPWQGQLFQVHQGVYTSAKRLMNLRSCGILATIKAALEEFDNYGLVLCGHSLGGAVAAVLAVLLSQPNTTSAGGASRFVTASSLASQADPISLPPNRPIHAYAYGPAACVSPALQRASRGLITSIVYGDDVVPYLSLGTLRDFQAVALAFKIDANDAKREVKQRVWRSFIHGFRSPGSDFTFTSPAHGQFFGQEGPTDPPSSSSWTSSFRAFGTHAEEEEEDHWPWSALRSLRASLLGDKLVPPGDVFVVEATPVLQRYAFVTTLDNKTQHDRGAGHDHRKSSNNKTATNIPDHREKRKAFRIEDNVEEQDEGNKNSAESNSQARQSFKPATRLTVQLVRDVERKFGEVRFSSGMFTDHFPLRYLRALDELERGLRY